MSTKPFGMPQEAFDAWPDCLVAGCPNKCCRALNSAYCHPHTLERHAPAVEALVESVSKNEGHDEPAQSPRNV